MLEVLISMFILAIGLLGLASLIPVGRFQITSAGNADRSSAAFRAAFRDTKVRRMLNPLMWLEISDFEDDITAPGVPDPWNAVKQPWVDLDDPATPNLDNPLQLGNSVCIDPWFIMNNLAKPNLTPIESARLRFFPLKLNNDPPGPGGLSEPPRMARATLRSWLSFAAPMMPFGVAERIFTWQDDVIFSRPENPEERPQMQFDWVNLAGVDVPLRRQVAGDYTWLVTITPATAAQVPMAGSSSLSGAAPTMMAAQYTVSVVVFYRRVRDAEIGANFLQTERSEPPTERMVYADFPFGSGLGGGTVRLRLPGPVPTDPTDSDQSDMPRLRPNRWLMLCGWVDDENVTTIDHRAVFKWYRIGAVGDGPTYDDVSREWTQDVTLIGPDWQVDDTLTGVSTGTDIDNFVDADKADHEDPTLDFVTVWAALFDGVVAVGQKTMSLDSWNQWSP